MSQFWIGITYKLMIAITTPLINVLRLHIPEVQTLSLEFISWKRRAARNNVIWDIRYGQFCLVNFYHDCGHGDHPYRLLLLFIVEPLPFARTWLEFPRWAIQTHSNERRCVSRSDARPTFNNLRRIFSGRLIEFLSTVLPFKTLTPPAPIANLH
ncbi:Hypothetical predicted protein [Cloeon dipterum]|uniref:Uncharacterized protein n=1 Tax=Cloeon dipterum TaxID=197152 RepID=A0A8S1DV85_9INSE|nr:Hypothetical predicted protein [Cloeon dipterum]